MGFENRFGHATSAADISTEPCGDKCPYCTGEMDNNTIEVYQEALTQHLTTLIFRDEITQIPALELVDKLHLDDTVCKKLYGKTKNGVKGKFRVDALVTQLILSEILGLRDIVKEGSDPVPCVFLMREKGNPCPLAIFTQHRWNDIRCKVEE